MASIGYAIFSFFGDVFAGALSAVDAITGTKKEPVDHSFQKPSPTDRRSPCPMVNALANHGYLPRDGKNVSLAQLVKGCGEGINLSPGATLLVGAVALRTSTTGSLFSFHLDDLNKHGIIEHDGSLSRHDAQSGDNHTFAPEVWAAVAAHFAGSETISIETAARARKDRLAKAPESNPEFNLSAEAARFSLIETSLYLRVFGQGTDGFARTEWVRTLFEQERLPFEEGYRRPEKPLTIAEISGLAKKVSEVD